MTERRILWLLGFGLSVIVGGLVVWAMTPGRMERAFNRIRPGMSEKEVETLFGERGTPLPTATSFGGIALLPREVGWGGEDGLVLVTFGENDEVESARFFSDKDPSHLQQFRSRLCSWLGW